MLRVLLVLVALLGMAVPATAQLTGIAAARGSDTLDLNGRQIRLAGIDGLELNQSCFVDGQPFACGASATRALQTLLDGIAVTCTPLAAAGVDGFEQATCTTAEGDVAANMVRRGWALADRSSPDAPAALADQMADLEEEARAAGAGAWAGAFVEPWIWREDVGRIEERYVARSLPLLREDVERGLIADRAGIDIFADVAVTFGGAGAVAGEVRARALGPDFINGAIGPREVFTWEAVAVALGAWRTTAAGGAIANAVAAAWAELEELPGPVVEVRDATTFYTAMNDAAAPLLAADRQPVLLIAATDNPLWFRSWFTGAPPEGAVIGARDDAWRGYMGTIDGIDVYVAAVPRDIAILVPDDLLTGVVYRRNDDGTVVTLSRDEAATPNELVFGYARTLVFRDDAPVHIHYPYEVAVPDNGS